jgi:DNA-binding transcriptional regulator GbsR (MarR family)
MEFAQARNRFIEAWGELGHKWGVGRRMVEIHALLLITPYPCSVSYIAKQLSIPENEAATELDKLLHWTVVSQEEINEDGLNYFKAEKDIWTLAQIIARERRERELLPILVMLQEVKDVNITEEKELAHMEEFKKITSDLESFSMKADKFLKKFGNANGNWFFKQVLSWIK